MTRGKECIVPKVSIVNAREDLQQAFGRALELIGLGDLIQPGQTVLLKPNRHGGHGYTSPDVLEAGAKWAFSKGAGEVWIGDGPVWSMVGDSLNEYFRSSGLLDACERSGAKPLDFHAGEYRLFRPNHPDLPETIGFSEYLYQADVVISVPLMKTHFNTLVTLGIKNLKGCMRPIDKKVFHEIELNHAIAEMCRMLAPIITVHLMDATVAYEGMGPGSGTPVEMGLLLASQDVVALDSVACDLMGIDPQQARLIRFCADRGVGIMDLDRIERVGEDPDLHRRRFRLPYEALADEFPDLRIISDNACSGCAMNLFRALEIARSCGQTVTCQTVVIGPSVDTEEQTLLVGRCTKPGWDCARHVKGCPPSVDSIREGLTGIPHGPGMPKS